AGTHLEHHHRGADRRRAGTLAGARPAGPLDRHDHRAGHRRLVRRRLPGLPALRAGLGRRLAAARRDHRLGDRGGHRATDLDPRGQPAHRARL
ncbi:MAG: hypothetical protein AVDCRST_MAG61-1393, partial [uncultured Friedmanniella sp.]